MKLKITVRYFGSVKDDSGIDAEVLDVDEGQTLNALVEALKTKHKELSSRRGPILVALNQNYAKEDKKLKDNDEVALFPVVSGG